MNEVGTYIYKAQWISCFIQSVFHFFLCCLHTNLGIIFISNPVTFFKMSDYQPSFRFSTGIYFSFLLLSMLIFLVQFYITLERSLIFFPPFYLIFLPPALETAISYILLILLFQSITVLTILLSFSVFFFNSSHYLSLCIEGRKQTIRKIN